MNIFLLDKNLRKCAAYHNDKHVVKMILESAQMLCSAHWVCCGSAPYKLTHVNHPCCVWVRESLDNYDFLCRLGLALCSEYTLRYGKVHKSQKVVEWCVANKPKVAKKGLTRFVLAMPDEYKGDDVVMAYRRYYVGEKKSFARYTRRMVPRWLIDGRK